MQNGQTQEENGNRKPHRSGARWFFVLLIAGAAISTAAVVGNAIASGDGYKSKFGWGHHGAGHGAGAVMFRQFDADRDGVLTEAELKSGAASRIEANDANGDSALSLEEFEAVWLEMTRSPMVRAFQRLDEDGDAQLTQQELNERIDWALVRMDRDGDGAITKRELGRKKHRHHDDDDDDD